MGSTDKITVKIIVFDLNCAEFEYEDLITLLSQTAYHFYRITDARKLYQGQGDSNNIYL